jgi:hypothetical protein
MKRKLFLSFSGLVRNIRDGQVTQEDLDNGLFYFGCSRGHVIQPFNRLGVGDDVTPAFKGDSVRAHKVHEQILKAVLSAEAEGRAMFRLAVGFTSYRDLNILLANSGYRLLRTEAGQSDHSDFSKPKVAQQVKEAGLDLEVHW